MKDLIHDIEEALRNRGFNVSKSRDDVLTATSGSLNLLIWLPQQDYISTDNPLDFINGMGLSKVDGVIVISNRAFYLADEVSKIIDTARVWYGIQLNLKVYAVDVYRLDEQLEEAINLALTTYLPKIVNLNEPDGVCPKCGSRLIIKYRHIHNSSIYGSRIREDILQCDNCMVKIHRVEVSNS